MILPSLKMKKTQVYGKIYLEEKDVILKMNKKTIKLIIFNFFVFIGVGIFGNAFFWDESIHKAGEITDETIRLAIITTVISIAISVYLYNKKFFYGVKNVKDNQDQYKINIYKKKTNDFIYLKRDLEEYYNHESNKYLFPGYVLEKSVKVVYEQSLKLSRLELGIAGYSDKFNNLIITSEFNEIEYNATIITNFTGNEINLITPNKNDFDLLRSNFNKTRNEKSYEENKKTVDKNESLIKLDKDTKNRIKKMLSLDLSQNQIDRIHNFYDRSIVKKNKLSSGFGFSETTKETIMSYKDISLVKNENELDLYLSKDKYILFFDPTNDEDIYPIETQEFELLNDLGMIEQNTDYPNIIKVKDIRKGENWINLSKGNKKEIIFPNKIIQQHVKNGYDFEIYVSKLLVHNGFKNVQVTKGSGDQGVDIFATSEDNVTYGFQTKYYTGTVGNDAVQQIIAGKTFYKIHVGVVVTNSFFTKSAIELADRSGILLWDMKKLNELAI